MWNLRQDRTIVFNLDTAHVALRCDGWLNRHVWLQSPYLGCGNPLFTSLYIMDTSKYVYFDTLRRHLLKCWTVQYIAVEMEVVYTGKLLIYIEIFSFISDHILYYFERMVMIRKKKIANILGRRQSQKRSLRWCPGWPPSRWWPVWSSPTQQTNTRLRGCLPFTTSQRRVGRGSRLTVVYTSFSALSRSFRVSGEHLVLSLQQLTGMPFSLK